MTWRDWCVGALGAVSIAVLMLGCVLAVTGGAIRTVAALFVATFVLWLGVAWLMAESDRSDRGV